MTINKENIEIYNKRFQEENIDSLMKELLLLYNEKVVFTTSMGVEDQVLLDYLLKLNKEFITITLDTGRLFSETYNLIEKTEKRYNIKIKIFFPERTQVESFVYEKGINSIFESVENRKQCCNIRKMEPLQRALLNSKIWITGLRKEQSDFRNTIQFAEWDSKFQMVKINPFINWTTNDIWDYVHKRNVPYNPLHDQNFPSIGCAPCTRSILPGEDLRAGRWWWESKEVKECGLHSRKV
jgi:phosphoadenosine phosphosulfate reductase